MKKRKKIVYFDMDGVLADYEGKATYKDNPEKETNGFFTELEPIEGAVEAFNKLSEHYDCFILTTAPWSSPQAMGEKRLWVEKHLGELAFKKLVTSHRKDLSRGHYLIDDRTVNGAGEFDGVHIHFGTLKFPNWDTVVKFLMAEYVRDYDHPTKSELKSMAFAEWVSPRYRFIPDEQYWMDNEGSALTTKDLLEIYKWKVLEKKS